MRGVSYNKNLYAIPLYSERRKVEDLKRTKRKMYRDRYAWLDSYNHAVKKALVS